MDLRHFDNPKAKTIMAPRVNHVKWVKALVQRVGVDTAYRVVRLNAVPMFISGKQSTVNEQSGFYQAALSYLKVNYQVQSKRGGI